MSTVKLEDLKGLPYEDKIIEVYHSGYTDENAWGTEYYVDGYSTFEEFRFFKLSDSKSLKIKKELLYKHVEGNSAVLAHMRKICEREDVKFFKGWVEEFYYFDTQYYLDVRQNIVSGEYECILYGADYKKGTNLPEKPSLDREYVEGFEYDWHPATEKELRYITVSHK